MERRRNGDVPSGCSSNHFFFLVVSWVICVTLGAGIAIVCSPVFTFSTMGFGVVNLGRVLQGCWSW